VIEARSGGRATATDSIRPAQTPEHRLHPSWPDRLRRPVPCSLLRRLPPSLAPPSSLLHRHRASRRCRCLNSRNSPLTVSRSDPELLETNSSWVTESSEMPLSSRPVTALAGTPNCSASGPANAIAVSARPACEGRGSPSVPSRAMKRRASKAHRCVWAMGVSSGSGAMERGSSDGAPWRLQRFVGDLQSIEPPSLMQGAIMCGVLYHCHPYPQERIRGGVTSSRAAGCPAGRNAPERRH